MTLRLRGYSFEEVNPDDLYADGHWITIGGRPMFIGGVQRKRRPKKPKRRAGKLVVRQDDKGNTFKNYEYSKAHKKRQARFKFAVTAALAKNKERIDRILTSETGMKKMGQRKAASTALAIMLKTGMRAGGGSGKGKPGMTKGQETFGTTTLQRRHVKVSGDEVEFTYRAKSGIVQTHKIKDEAIAGSVRRFMGDKDSAPDDQTPLFQYKEKGKKDILSLGDVSKRFKKFDKDYSPKDLRTLKANEVASDAALDIMNRDIKVPKKKGAAKKMIKELVKEVSERVAKKLGNEPNTAKGHYINPALMEAMLAKMGF